MKKDKENQKKPAPSVSALEFQINEQLEERLDNDIIILFDNPPNSSDDQWNIIRSSILSIVSRYTLGNSLCRIALAYAGNDCETVVDFSMNFDHIKKALSEVERKNDKALNISNALTTCVNMFRSKERPFRSKERPDAGKVLVLANSLPFYTDDDYSEPLMALKDTFGCSIITLGTVSSKKDQAQVQLTHLSAITSFDKIVQCRDLGDWFRYFSSIAARRFTRPICEIKALTTGSIDLAISHELRLQEYRIESFDEATELWQEHCTIETTEIARHKASVSLTELSHCTQYYFRVIGVLLDSTEDKTTAEAILNFTTKKKTAAKISQPVPPLHSSESTIVSTGRFFEPANTQNEEADKSISEVSDTQQKATRT